MKITFDDGSTTTLFSETMSEPAGADRSRVTKFLLVQYADLVARVQHYIDRSDCPGLSEDYNATADIC